MPRARKNKPIAEATETAQVSAQPDAIEAECTAMKPLTPGQLAQPSAEAFVPGDSYEGDLPATAADFTPPQTSFVRVTAKPAYVGGTLDERQGIRIDVETERQPGHAQARILIKFRNDMPPSDEEKSVLRSEGFRYEAADKAWTAPRTAANLVVAKRAVNHITHQIRGDEGVQLFV